MSAVLAALSVQAAWLIAFLSTTLVNCLLAGVLVLFLLDRCSPQHYIRTVMAAGAVMLLALSWCNEGALVTRFNLSLYEDRRIAADASIFGSAASAGEVLKTAADPDIRLAAQSYLDFQIPLHEYRWNYCTEELPLNR